MNAETHLVYETPEEILAAATRGEKLIYGTREELSAQGGVFLNRAVRRKQARAQAAEARRAAKRRGNG